MRILLDTHILIWAAEARSRVPAAAQALMDQPGVTNIFSVASIWETAIKFALNRADFRMDPQILRRGLFDNGYEELIITAPTPSPQARCRHCTATRSTASSWPRSARKAACCCRRTRW